jgi:hypothetical protein
VALGVLIAATVVPTFAAPEPRHDMLLGVTFSPRYARYLGLDARSVYVDMLDQIGVRHVRLPVYWDEVEPTPGVYDFSELGYYLTEAEARGVGTLLSVGYKQPRWPECYPPAWAGDLPLGRIRDHILRLVEAEVTYARSQPGIVMWQAENEPFVPFGDCRNFDVLTPAFMTEEINLIHRLDTRPVLITDSGEHSTWLPAMHMSGVQLGISVYRDIPMPKDRVSGLL